MSNKEQSQYEVLRDKFRAELLKPFSERYFDEEDLINLFDAAGDEFDDYIRLEALIMAARLYPDSVPFLERRAIFYLNTNRKAFENLLEDNSHISSNMLTILRLNLFEGMAPKDIEALFPDLVDNIKLSYDEEIIQFVQTLHNLRMDEWLVKNLDNLKQKASSVATLLYEYAFHAEASAELSAISVKVLEELTGLDAYVAEYWTMLARAYIRENRIEDAENALEYALAIDPEDFMALKTRLFIHSNYKDDPRKVIELVKGMIKYYPGDSDTAAIAAFLIEDREENHKFVDSLPDSAKYSTNLIAREMECDYPRLQHLLENAYDYGVDAFDEWCDIADWAYALNKTEALRMAMEVYHRKSGRNLNHDYLMLRIMFDSENYPVATRIFMDAEKDGTIMDQENFFSAFSIYIVSLLRLSEFDRVKKDAAEMIVALDKEIDFGSKTEKAALKFFLNTILEKLSARKKYDWNKLQPLV